MNKKECPNCGCLHTTQLDVPFNIEINENPFGVLRKNFEVAAKKCCYCNVVFFSDGNVRKIKENW